MIRCGKCGYSNQDNLKVCVKCRTKLEIEEVVLGENYGLPSKKTIVIPNQEEKPWDQPNAVQVYRNVKEIDKPVQEQSNFKEVDKPVPGQKGFREIGNPVKEQMNLRNGGVHTVRRVLPGKRSCYLVALSLDEERELREIQIAGETISLDRAKLDPENTSISRSGHAKLFLKDGSWYLENTTALKTTFVQVNEPVKISDGDVILLGDSLFRFKQE